MRKSLHFLSLMSILILLVGCSQYAKVSKRPIWAITESPEQRELYSSARTLSKQPLQRLGHYLDAVNDARLKLAKNSSDTTAQSNYDFAVARIVEIIENDNLKPWEKPLSCPSRDKDNWSFTLTPPDPRPEYHPSNFHMLPSDRYRFKGTRVGERVLPEGMGAPVIVIGKDFDFTKIDQFAQGKHLPSQRVEKGDLETNQRTHCCSHRTLARNPGKLCRRQAVQRKAIHRAH